MSWKSVLACCVVSTALAGLAIIFANNGLKDLARMTRQMKETHAHIEEVEKENQELRRRVDVIETHPQEAIETYIRSELGWVRENERVYVEGHQKIKR